MYEIHFAVITVSDRCFRLEQQDKSGAVLKDLITQSSSFRGKVATYEILPDELDRLRPRLQELTEYVVDKSIDVVLTTGGTGFAQRDVTPEATVSVLRKQCPGIVQALINRSLQATPMAALSRLCAGITHKTLIINLPGSPKAVKECFEVLEPLLTHAVQLIKDEKEPVQTTHNNMIGVHEESPIKPVQIMNSKSSDCINQAKIDFINAPIITGGQSFMENSSASEEEKAPVAMVSVVSCSEGTVGTPVHFSVDVSFAEPGDLEMTVVIDGEEIEVVQNNMDDSADKSIYDLSFWPMKCGVYVVSVKYDSQNVIGCPFECNVQESHYDNVRSSKKEGSRSKSSSHRHLHDSQEMGAHSRVVIDAVNRPRKSQYPMFSVEDALDLVLKYATDLPIRTEEVRVSNCIGRILAEDILATASFPPFNASIKDGYAILASDGMKDRTVIDAITAGDNIGSPKHERKYGKYSAIRISTGAAVPCGFDAVIQVEDTQLVDIQDGEEKVISLSTKPKKGQDIRAMGCDIAEGELVLGVGSTLGSGDVGLLTSLGLINVLVTVRPITAVLSTGNEIVDIGKSMEDLLTFGNIYDSNRPQTLSLIQQHAFPVFDAGIAIDDPDELLVKIRHALNLCDVLVTSGGVSMGEKDLLKQVLEQDLGFTIHFGRVFMKPGKPTTFATGTLNGNAKVVFGLPGNPVSSWVTTHLYVLPALRLITDVKRSENRAYWTHILVKIDRKIHLDPRPEYHRATLVANDTHDDYPTAVSTGTNQISSRLLNTRGANLLLVLPPKSDNLATIKKGTVVKALVIGNI